MRLPYRANGLFYPNWNRLYRFTAYRWQCSRLPGTDLTQDHTRSSILIQSIDARKARIKCFLILKSHGTSDETYFSFQSTEGAVLKLVQPRWTTFLYGNSNYILQVHIKIIWHRVGKVASSPKRTWSLSQLTCSHMLIPPARRQPKARQN